MARELSEFVARALERGLAKPEIEAVLLESGWPGEEVRSALDAYADVEFPVAVPRPRPYLSAREAFLYLVLFLTLYTFAIAWGKLLFQLVHAAFPDPSVDRPWPGAAQPVRWALASLVVAFPAYLWLARRSHRSVRRNPAERTSRVRKWLTHVTLFVTAAVLLCDLITLVYRALGGELSVRFLLKVAIVGGIAGGVFAYYLWLARQDDLDPAELPPRNRGLRVVVALTVAAVVASFAAGLVLVGSPRAARVAALDDRRIEDLHAIQWAIDEYWRLHRELPSELTDLVSTGHLPEPGFADPVSGEPYEYRGLEGNRYELCASFDAASSGKDPSARHRLAWLHPAGRFCFELQARG